MKKILIIALLAMPFVIPGMTMSINAAPVSNVIVMEDAPIDSKLVEAILKQISVETGLSYEHLKGCYDCGDLTIDKVVEGYLVTLSAADGGIGIILAEINS